MSESSQAVLLIVDISGYTRFMRQHTVALNHAKQIIVRLLKSLIRASHPPLQVAELEGDAVFFYALAAPGEIESTVRRVQEQIPRLFNAFHEELVHIDNVKSCSCDACDHVHDLKLKQVVHLGDILIETIGRFEKLFGLDVILVHRMLKNSVPVREYIMMTSRLYAYAGDFFGLQPDQRTESFEGVGDVETFVFYPIPGSSEFWGTTKPAPAPAREKLAWRFSMTLNLLLEVLGIRKIGGVFNNIPSS